MDYPQIISKKTQQISKWVEVLEKEVAFSPNGRNETYHCITQAAYVGIIARCTDGKIAIVRQYRPCVEEHTWEFVGGTLDGEESPLEAAQRELAEEAGLVSDSWQVIGDYLPDTGRLDLCSYGVFAENCEHIVDWVPEAGVEVDYVSLNQLINMIETNAFRHQLHYGILASAILKRLINV